MKKAVYPPPLILDVMVNNGRTFYRTLRYSYCPLFKFDLEALFAWVFEQLPSMRTRKDAVYFLKFPNGEEYQATYIPNSSGGTNADNHNT